MTKEEIKIGENIKRLRKGHGYTQSQLADLLEVAGDRKNRVISSWENNVARPSYEYLIGMTKIFGVSLEELLLVLSNDSAIKAPMVEEPQERYVVASQLQEMEKKLLELSKQVSEDREDRETLLKKLEEYEQVILDLKRNYPSPLPE
ncbi:MAG: helix-turn-helix transcriptional regulator [Bacteroidota bacterium]